MNRWSTWHNVHLLVLLLLSSNSLLSFSHITPGRTSLTDEVHGGQVSPSLPSLISRQDAPADPPPLVHAIPLVVYFQVLSLSSRPSTVLSWLLPQDTEPRGCLFLSYLMPQVHLPACALSPQPRAQTPSVNKPDFASTSTSTSTSASFCHI